MSLPLLILCLAGAVYALRLGGFLLAGVAAPPVLERTLALVPIATLTALTVAGLTSPAHEAPVRLAAALGAGFVARRTGKAWVCIAAGMALYWLLRAVSG